MAGTGYVRIHDTLHDLAPLSSMFRHKVWHGADSTDFSNVLSKGQIEEMAEADELEVVKEVQEYFADYLAQYQSHFTLTQAALADGGEGPPNVGRRSCLGVTGSGGRAVSAPLFACGTERVIPTWGR